MVDSSFEITTRTFYIDKPPGASPYHIGFQKTSEDKITLLFAPDFDMNPENLKMKRAEGF